MVKRDVCGREEVKVRWYIWNMISVKLLDRLRSKGVNVFFGDSSP